MMQITSTQKVASDAQVEKMEKELAKMRSGLDESVQLMEQRDMNTNIEYISVHHLLLLSNKLTPTQIRATNSPCELPTRRTSHRD